MTAKVRAGIELAKQGLPIPWAVESTHGGNTTCVEVNMGDELFILDMGTGVRELGKAQLPNLLKTRQLKGTILQSHVHWDHIQGFPFWAPMYLDRRVFKSTFDFFGGKQWDSQLDVAYRGQMDAPYFPVNLEELEKTGMHMNFQSIYDGWEKLYQTPEYNSDTGPYQDTRVRVSARKLNHPQETLGIDSNLEAGSSHSPPIMNPTMTITFLGDLRN